MKLLDLLRTIIAWPFLAVAFVFYKVYEFIDPFAEWELNYYNDIILFDDCDDEDCC
jgi:hypothetical protein